MRALYVNHTATISGAEISLLGVLRNLPTDVDPVVACPRGPLADRVLALGLPVEYLSGTRASLRLNPVHTSRGIAEIFRSAAQLSRIAKRTGADLIHANSTRAGLICLLRARHSRPPTIVHLRDSLPTGWTANLARRVVERADLVIANSTYTAGTIGLQGRPVSMEVVPNAVDLDYFKPNSLSRTDARRELGFNEGVPLLGVVGQLTPWKGQDDAIRAVAALAGRWPALRLLVVGSVKFGAASTRYDNNAYLASLKRLVAELSVGDRVLFLGERQDIPVVLRSLDLTLVPSWEEPFGRVVIEAMAMCTPVVATNVGGPAEVIGTGTDGLLLPPRQPACWAAAIDRLLADPVMRQRMSSAGRAKVELTFGQMHQSARLAALYKRLIRERVGI